MLRTVHSREDYPLLFSFLRGSAGKKLLIFLRVHLPIPPEMSVVGLTEVFVFEDALIHQFSPHGSSPRQKSRSMLLYNATLEADGPTAEEGVPVLRRIQEATKKIEGSEALSILYKIMDNDKPIRALILFLTPYPLETKKDTVVRVSHQFCEKAPLSLQLVAPELNRLLDSSFAEMREVSC